LKTQTGYGLLSPERGRRFRTSILAWYELHRRNLPWRASREPYRVWISEIMLQQTRVAAVIEHYREFLRRFPTIAKLAAAREASVLAAWSGLGYYRRARMLHAAAQVMVRQHGGSFPATEKELRALPGIGRYTAAAIASIAFGEAVAVVDGNVERVLQRLVGARLAGEDVWDTANRLLDSDRPGDFNQAMMELGATICTPRSPSCLTCPVLEFCATRGELPPLEKPARQAKQEIHYALHHRPEVSRASLSRKGDSGRIRTSEVFLRRRERKASLMPGMWELPEFAPPNPAVNPWFTLRHSITVTDYTVRVWRAKPSDFRTNKMDGKWIPLARLRRMALTGLARKILLHAKLL
jgi:A/G-specific adenine glycosylase